MGSWPLGAGVGTAGGWSGGLYGLWRKAVGSVPAWGLDVRVPGGYQAAGLSPLGRREPSHGRRKASPGGPVGP